MLEVDVKREPLDIVEGVLSIVEHYFHLADVRGAAFLYRANKSVIRSLLQALAVLLLLVFGAEGALAIVR